MTVTSRVCQEDGGSFSVAGSESSPVGPGIKLRKVHCGFKSTYLSLSGAHRTQGHSEAVLGRRGQPRWPGGLLAPRR